METARIANRAAQEVVNGLDLFESAFPDGWTESAIDALIEDVDRELANDGRTAERRVSRAFTDARRARRSQRRAERDALGSLSGHLLIDGVPRSGKSVSPAALLLFEPFGEAA